MDIDDVYVLYPARGLKCSGCNLIKECYSDGYRCYRSGLFFHEECFKSDLEINNLYHPQHSLTIKVVAETEDIGGECKLCRGNLSKMCYYCSICDFAIDLICARKEVMTTIDGPKAHEHPLSLVPKMIKFTCHLCGVLDDRFPYMCHLCEVSFHKDCGESIPEINFSCHPKHPLMFLTRVPSYTNGKCCLCGNKFHNVLYHCSICNFSVDVNCAKNPPPFTLVVPKAHDHQLTLLPQRTCVCNACGMIDDNQYLYICPQCNFMIHRKCIDAPRIIKINRHEHRVHYLNFLKAGDWKCRVCHQEIIWTCGAYSCLECTEFAVHLKCATKFGIWDGVELDGTSECNVEIQSYEVVEEGTIKHFLHEGHALKLKEEAGVDGETMWCIACSYPIYSSPFYSCMECDDFILHQKCAYLPKQKIDPIYKMSVTLVSDDGFSLCDACQNISTGFMYYGDGNIVMLDVRCGSISEPLVHDSHPIHSLYINHSTENIVCNACGDKASIVLSCEECGFFLDIKCSILPKMIKHKTDTDHFLSLCYGEKMSEQEYWCEICEEELNPKKWFYSCDLCGITLHIRCALGDFFWIKPSQRSTSFGDYVIPNNFTNRLICDYCKSRCSFPSIMKYYKYTLCSSQCYRMI